MVVISSVSGGNLVSSQRQDVKTFSDNLPERELCQAIENMKSFSIAKSRMAVTSDSDHGSIPL